MRYTVCKLCDKIMQIGESMALHIFTDHPNIFINIMIELNPQMVIEVLKYYEENEV